MVCAGKTCAAATKP